MKKKILFISHSSSISGAENCLVHLLERMRRDHFEPIVLFPSQGPLSRLIQSFGIETEIHNYPLWIAAGEKNRLYFKNLMEGMPKRVRFFRDFIKSNNIGLVYTNTIASMDGAIASKLEKVPHIWHIHEILRKYTYVKTYLPHFILKMMINYLSVVVIVPSDAAKRHYETIFNNKKIRIIYNGVDINRFDRCENCDDNNSFRRGIGLKNQKIVALIGYFNEMKGQDVFVDAAKIVSGRFKDTVYLFVGDEDADREYIDTVRQKIRSYCMEDNFIFLGFRNDIENIMRSIDVFVSASRVESFSNVICEAMAAGKPVVATESGGPEEIILNGKTGFLVPVNNAGKMADAIIKLLSDEGCAQQMGANGRRRVEEFFNIDQYVENIENVLVRSMNN